jgi:putative mRNA 3-end processing factor
VLATAETIEIMKVRMGAECAGRFEDVAIGASLSLGGVAVRLVPAGHILGSAQVVLDWRGQRAVVSGDYKRSPDPTCRPFEPVACDVFVTEATFALPVFRHEPAAGEVARLLASLARNPERSHLIGAYGLGKCQRIIRLARDAGYDAPVYLHGAMLGTTAIYERFGIDLGDIRAVSDARPADLAGALVICPPSATADRWSRRFPDPLTGFASGWMRIRGRVRQSGVELPLVISDHADWPELIETVLETGAEDIWVTHGRDDALVYELGRRGLKARALALVGFEDEGE